MAQEHGRFIPADGGRVRYPKAPRVSLHTELCVLCTQVELPSALAVHGSTQAEGWVGRPWVLRGRIVL